MSFNKITNPLDFFTGGVPATAIFSMNISEVVKILQTIDKSDKEKINPNYEICFIGMVAYFEAFFKDFFASLINIHPPLLINLKNKQYDLSVDLCDLIELGITNHHYYGFIIAEKFDFGTPQKVNSLYQSLINISPFSKDEKKEYEKILNDRNLLVHHGGIYTTKYSQQNIKKTKFTERVFFDSIVLSYSEVSSKIDFCKHIVNKLTKSTVTKFNEMLKSKELNRIIILRVQSNY